MCHFCFRGRRDIHLEDLAPIRSSARQTSSNTQPEQQQMTRQQIQEYLQAVAKYLHRKRENIVVVGVGGVLSTLALGTRTTTHDVDIFCEGISPNQANDLRSAIRDVARKAGLDEYWLNNQTILHIPSNLRAQIQQDALRQNHVIFEESGLKIVAAPWIYAFVSKLHRISGSGAGPSRSYDPADAVNFLAQYLRAQQCLSLTVSQIKSWMAHYGVDIGDEALTRAVHQVNTAAGRAIITRA